MHLPAVISLPKRERALRLPQNALFLRDLPWVGKVQATAMAVLFILSIPMGYAGLRILHETRQIRNQIAAQTNIRNVTEHVQKTMLREHLALLEYFITHDQNRLLTSQNLRHRAFREMTQLLSNSTDSALQAEIVSMSNEVRDYFQTLDRAPSGEIAKTTGDLRRIESLGNRVLGADEGLMDKERLQFRSRLTLERRITLWAGSSLIFLLLAVLWYGLSLIRPVSELLHAIGRIKEGDFNFQIPVRRKDDMGRLADSFNGMIRTVNLQQQRLVQESETDGLTGLYNTKHFWVALRAAAEETYKTGISFSLLMIDIDHFKEFNDRFGHEFGNAVIKITAATIKQNLRASDILARYGGDEFVVILPETSAEEGSDLAKRMEAAAAASIFPTHKTGALSELTLSIGGATFLPTHKSLEVLICRSDDALYAAKHSGRACVRWADELLTKHEEAAQQRRLVS